MEVRLEGIQVMYDKLHAPVIPRSRFRFWFIRVCSSIILWTCLVQLVTVSELWHSNFFTGLTRHIYHTTQRPIQGDVRVTESPRIILPARNYTSNGFLRVSCNGGLNQMRAAICDMVIVAQLLNLTLVVPELDKKSFWVDHSGFEGIFDVKHFIDSLQDEVRIVKSVPKTFSSKGGYSTMAMPPVSWSNEKYYLEGDIWAGTGSSAQTEVGNGLACDNLSRHQARLQAAASAASIYEKSYVYPSPTFACPPGYTLHPMVQRSVVESSNAELDGERAQRKLQSEGSKATGAFILTTSHNPGGPNEDFGIKYNMENGGPAPEGITNKIYENTTTIKKYLIAPDLPNVDITTLGVTNCTGPEGPFDVEVFDSASDYITLMKSIFDFESIRKLLTSPKFSFCYDALHGVAGAYAKHIFVDGLGAQENSLINCVPKVFIRIWITSMISFEYSGIFSNACQLLICG